MKLKTGWILCFNDVLGGFTPFYFDFNKEKLKKWAIDNKICLPYGYKIIEAINIPEEKEVKRGRINPGAKN